MKRLALSGWAVAALCGSAALAQESVPALRLDRPAAPADAAGEEEGARIADRAQKAYAASDYPTARDLAQRYLDWARERGLAGRRLAEIQFILGHAGYEIRHAAGAPAAADAAPAEYRARVVTPLEDSFRVLQDNAAFKTLLLGNAWFDLWRMSGGRDAESEAQAHWYLLKSILIREDEARAAAPDDAARERLDRYRLYYLDHCLEMARSSPTPDLYVDRVRAAAARGLGSAYADRFRQIYDLTWFDGGNMRAAALWQYALDGLEDTSLGVDAVVVRFEEAGDACRGDRSRAEVDRQVADYLAVVDRPERRVQAADYARRAYELAPDDPEIRRQYGSALHLLAVGAYTTGRFEDSMRYATQAVAFEWQGNELAHFDLSRAAAELGRADEALRHGEEAYREARLHTAGPALQPYAQNYVNVLRQFGQEDQAARVMQESSALGVR